MPTQTLAPASASDFAMAKPKPPSSATPATNARFPCKSMLRHGGEGSSESPPRQAATIGGAGSCRGRRKATEQRRNPRVTDTHGRFECTRQLDVRGERLGERRRRDGPWRGPTRRGDAELVEAGRVASRGEQPARLVRLCGRPARNESWAAAVDGNLNLLFGARIHEVRLSSGCGRGSSEPARPTD